MPRIDLPGIKSKEAPGYDRDSIVAEITSFYKLLSAFYIPADAIIYPPPDGWPEVTPKNYSFLEKTDAVIDLIRHLPFIQPICHHPEEDLSIYELWPETAPVHYISDRFHNDRVFGRHDGIGPTWEAMYPNYEDVNIPSHVLTFAVPNAQRYGDWAFIDTERGTITICAFADDWKGGVGLISLINSAGTTTHCLQYQFDPIVYDEDSDDGPFRIYTEYVPKTFFDHMKQKYRLLEYVSSSSPFPLLNLLKRIELINH